MFEGADIKDGSEFLFNPTYAANILNVAVGMEFLLLSRALLEFRHQGTVIIQHLPHCAAYAHRAPVPPAMPDACDLLCSFMAVGDLYVRCSSSGNPSQLRGQRKTLKANDRSWCEVLLLWLCRRASLMPHLYRRGRGLPHGKAETYGPKIDGKALPCFSTVDCWLTDCPTVCKFRAWFGPSGRLR